MKYFISIELSQDGSTTHLGDFKISAKLADTLCNIGYEKPNELKRIVALMVSKLEGCKNYILNWSQNASSN